MLNISCLTVGIYQENTYVVEKEGHYLVIDPGSRADKIRSLLPEEGKADGILLTHGHVDHIGAVDRLYREWHCPVYISHADSIMARDPYLNVSGPSDISLRCPLTEISEGKMQVGPFSINVIETPGHTSGSLCFLIEDALFSGDTLFAGSIGRSDLPTGNHTEMKQTLAYLKTLDPSIRVFPGHDEATTIEQELLLNPFLQ